MYYGRNKRGNILSLMMVSNVPSSFIGRVKRTKLKVEGTCEMKRKCVTTRPKIWIRKYEKPRSYPKNGVKRFWNSTFLSKQSTTDFSSVAKKNFTSYQSLHLLDANQIRKIQGFRIKTRSKSHIVKETLPPSMETIRNRYSTNRGNSKLYNVRNVSSNGTEGETLGNCGNARRGVHQSQSASRCGSAIWE